MKTPEELVDAFAQSMKDELKANEHKGDWRTWNGEWEKLDELYYHIDKLKSALLNNDKPRIKEYAADSANFLLMIGNEHDLY